MEVSPGNIRLLLEDFVYPRTHEGLYWYQLFHVPRESDAATQPLLDDITCGTGSLALLSYLNDTLGLPLHGFSSAAEVPFTTVELYTKEFEAISNETGDLLAFYAATAKLLHAEGWFSRLLDLFALDSREWKYVHTDDPNGARYFRFRSRNPQIRIRHAPRPDWRALKGPAGREDPAAKDRSEIRQAAALLV
jgi:hypothetical protein